MLSNITSVRSNDILQLLIFIPYVYIYFFNNIYCMLRRSIRNDSLFMLHKIFTCSCNSAT